MRFFLRRARSLEFPNSWWEVFLFPVDINIACIKTAKEMLPVTLKSGFIFLIQYSLPFEADFDYLLKN